MGKLVSDVKPLDMLKILVIYGKCINSDNWDKAGLRDISF